MNDRPQNAEDFRVPDCIEPISAFRVWRVDSDLELHSLNDRARWVPGEWMTAHCQMQDHTAPREGCTCGVYAAKDLNYVTLMPHGPAIVGKVRLAGKVIEHDGGYRAERAQIVELLPIEGKGQLTESVAGRYRVPIGDVIPALSIPDIDNILRSATCVYVARDGVPGVPKTVVALTTEHTLLGRLYILAVSLFFVINGMRGVLWEDHRLDWTDWWLCAIVIGGVLGVCRAIATLPRSLRGFSIAPHGRTRPSVDVRQTPVPDLPRPY